MHTASRDEPIALCLIHIMGVHTTGRKPSVCRATKVRGKKGLSLHGEVREISRRRGLCVECEGRVGCVEVSEVLGPGRAPGIWGSAIWSLLGGAVGDGEGSLVAG